jgi:hypothetical protein
MRLNDLIKIRLELSKAKFSNDKSKKEQLAALPWDECIKKVAAEYDGDEEIAAKVCGAIKAQNASSEKFTIPTPDKGESQDDYVSRCMGVIGGEDKPQDQLVAICIATYQNK